MENFSSQIPGKYQGERGALFKLAMVTSLLTLVTLGIYRFWAKTRIRKYIWSSTSGDGDAFEYTGTGLEKFLGFLVAIVVLAIYLGIVQMALFYFGMNLFSEPKTQTELIAQLAATYITLFAVMPLIFFAQYRSRRYKLARTRWRGVRFGAEKGAWGYVWRKIGHILLTSMTLGIMLPRQTFYLEKYVTDRSWFGTEKFEQGGRWQELYPAMKHIFIGLVILIGGGVLGGLLQSPPIMVITISVGYVWFLVGTISYRVKSFSYLAAHKKLAGDIAFRAEPETGSIIGIIILGGLAVSAIIGVLLLIFWSLFSSVLEPASNVSPVVAILAMILYVGVLVIIGAMSLVMITQPIIDHVVGSISVHNPDALNHIGQRESDTGADADGFADALDIGGAI